MIALPVSVNCSTTSSKPVCPAFEMASLILTPTSCSNVWAIIDLEPAVAVVFPVWVSSDDSVDKEVEVEVVVVVLVLVRDSSSEVVLPGAWGWSVERVMDRCWPNILDSPILSA